MPDQPAARQNLKNGMPAPRPNGSGGMIFAAVFLATCIGISTIVLLANDKRNLRLALKSSGLEWLTVRTPPPKAPPVALKGQPVKPEPLQIPDYVLAQVDADALSGFARDMPRIGPELCKAFDDSGFANSGWGASPFDASSFECIAELTFDSGGPVEDRGSLFFTAKGNQDGEISSLRMKLIAPESADGRAAHAAMLKALHLLITCTGWEDLKDLMASARRLKEYSADYLGLEIKFSREFSSPDRFNLFVLHSDSDPAIRRTRTYFEQQPPADNRQGPQPSRQKFVAPAG